MAVEPSPAQLRKRTALRGRVASPRVTAVLVLFPLALLLAVYAYTALSTIPFFGGPSGMGFGSDFAMFYSAAKVIHAGGNPYDNPLLFRTESAAFHAQHVPMTSVVSWVRVGNPPLLFWLLQPLAQLPFRLAAWSWIGFMALLSIVGLAGCLRFLGWNHVLPTVPFFLAMPATLIGVFNGNVIPIVFAGLGLSLYAISRYPACAGALLVTAWLKPSLALPFVGLVIVFHATNRRRVATGFALTTAAAVMLTVLTTGPASLVAWVQALSAYSRDMATQPEIATLSGLYVHGAAVGTRQTLQAITLGVAGVVTVCTWFQIRRAVPVPILSIGWLWALWFLAVPYAHNNDTILLAPPILSLLGRDAARVGHVLPALSLYLLFSTALSVPIPTLAAELEPVKLLCVALCLALAAYLDRTDRPPSPFLATTRLCSGAIQGHPLGPAPPARPTFTTHHGFRHSARETHPSRPHEDLAAFVPTRDAGEPGDGKVPVKGKRLGEPEPAHGDE